MRWFGWFRRRKPAGVKRPSGDRKAQACASCGKIWALDLLDFVSVTAASIKGGGEAGAPEMHAYCPGCLTDMGFDDA